MASRRGVRYPLGRRAAPPRTAARRTRSCADSFQSLILAFKAWNGSMNVLFIRPKGARVRQARTNVSRETSRAPARWNHEHRNSHRLAERPRGKSGRAKPGDRKKNALQRVRALERIAGAVSSQRRRGRAAEECLQRPPQPAQQARRHSFSRSTTSKGVRAASMMSLLPNVHTASCATAAARGAASARTACASAAVISARVSRRASGVRPPK